MAIQSFNMTLTRDCLCPVVVTRGADQVGGRASVPDGHGYEKSSLLARAAAVTASATASCTCVAKQCG